MKKKNKWEDHPEHQLILLLQKKVNDLDDKVARLTMQNTALLNVIEMTHNTESRYIVDYKKL